MGIRLAQGLLSSRLVVSGALTARSRYRNLATHRQPTSWPLGKQHRQPAE
jgi:hypothetical protein